MNDANPSSGSNPSGPTSNPATADAAPSESTNHRPPQAPAVAGELASERERARAHLQDRAKAGGEKTDEQRERERARARLNRSLSALEKAKKAGPDAYAAELLRQAKEHGGGGDSSPPTGSPESGRADEAPGAPAAAPANDTQYSPPLPPDRTFKLAAGRAGWPSDQDVAQWAPYAAMAVAALERACVGTRFEFTPPPGQVRVYVLGTGEAAFDVPAPGPNELATALAVVFAKHGPKLLTTPEGNLMLTAGLLFGVPAAGWAGEKIREARAKKKAAA